MRCHQGSGTTPAVVKSSAWGQLGGEAASPHRQIPEDGYRAAAQGTSAPGAASSRVGAGAGELSAPSAGSAARPRALVLEMEPLGALSCAAPLPLCRPEPNWGRHSLPSH